MKLIKFSTHSVRELMPGRYYGQIRARDETGLVWWSAVIIHGDENEELCWGEAWDRLVVMIGEDLTH